MSESQVYSPEALPLLCEGVDFKSLNISPEEGFLLSNIDGSVRIRHLVMMSGMSQDQAMQLIQGLVEKKIIMIHEPREKTAHKTAVAPVKIVINEKDVPTGKDFEAFVDKLLEVMNRTDYYSLLSVERTAKIAEVKKAYRKLSRIFHPDQHFRKVTPEFSRKLQEVFKQINIAYQVLSNDERRRTYATQLKEKGVEGAGEELRLEVARKIYTGPKLKLGLKEDKKKAKDEKLKRLFANVQSRSAPEHVQKAERLCQLALQEIRKKNFKSARTNVRLALQLDPMGAKKYQAELARIDQLEGSLQAETQFEEGRAAEDNGEYQRANRCYAEALGISPENKKYIFSQARIMIKYLNNFERGRGLLLKLLESENKNPEYYYLLGLAYRGLGQKRAAQVQLEKTLELDPKHREAQKELKALK